MALGEYKFIVPATESDEDKKEFVYWADIHTLAIEIEQIRRFGTIQYDSELMTENILEKVLLEQSQE